MMLPFSITSYFFLYQKCILNYSSLSEQKMGHTAMKPFPTKLVDDLVVEILSRVPAKSSMRFQCVSRAKLAFTSNIYYRKKLPATMSGLFYTVSTRNTDTSWSSDIKYPSLSPDRTIDATRSFLPHLQNLDILDTCNGLLLYKSWNAKSEDDCYYMSATLQREKGLPSQSQMKSQIIFFLAFNPRVSHHFHVLHFDDGVKRTSTQLEIFSSKTGGYLNFAFKREDKIEFWILKDNCNNEWVLKHSMDMETIPNKERSRTVDPEFYLQNFDYFDIVAFHPDLDVVFLQVGDELLAYHLNSARTEKTC